jgi:aquaporin NIP
MSKKLVKLGKRCMSEFIGTFGLVFIGCGSVMVSERFPGTVPAVTIPIIFGAVVAAMVYTLGHISGAHINPAVTIAFAYARHFPKKEVTVYCTAQVLGSITAIGLLAVILPEGERFGATVPAVPLFESFIWEIVLTFFLMFVVISVATDMRAVGTLAGLVIGITVTFCSYVGGPVTGASMNPARSIGPALFENQLEHLWLYLTAPVIGALLAAAVYKKIK